MTDILQIFSANPLSTFIGKKIEAATRPELDSDDWALILEICDIINESDDDAKDAARAIKKRLQSVEQDRNFVVTNRTLTILEACVNNCSRRFHVLVMTKDFIQDLVKLIGPKNNPPTDLQERVLSLIERWAEAFVKQPELIGVVQVYNDLKAKGITFPTRDPNSTAPIQTPQRSVPPPAMQMSASPPTSVSNSARRNRSTPSRPIVLEGEGYNKISQDLSVVQSSVEMFEEILQILDSRRSDESDWKLASDLNSTCRQMKDRIVELIEQVANEDLTIELLRLNDDLNKIFVKYDRLVKNRSKSKTKTDADQSAASVVGSSSALANPSPRLENELSLIDFSHTDEPTEPKTVAPKASSVEQQKPVDPFDTSLVEGMKNSLQKDLGRLSLEDKGATSQSKGNRLPDEISTVREQDFDEIANWLSSGGDSPSIEPISIPNSEFEKFIESRALAGSSHSASKQQKPDDTQSSTSRSSKQQPEPST